MMLAGQALHAQQIEADSKLLADIHAKADYRAHLITVMAKRAVAKALEG